MSRGRTRRARGEPPFSLFAFQDIMAAVTGVMIVTTLVLILDLLTRTVTASPPTPTDAAVSAERESLLRERDRLTARVAAQSTEATTGPVTPTQLAVARESAERARRARAEAEQRAASLEAARVTLEAGRAASERGLAGAEGELAELETRLREASRRVRVTFLDGEADAKHRWFVRCRPGSVVVSELDDERLLREAHAFAAERAFLAWASEADPAAAGFVLLVEPGGVEVFDRLQRGLRSRGFDVGWDLAPPQHDSGRGDG